MKRCPHPSHGVQLRHRCSTRALERWQCVDYNVNVHPFVGCTSSSLCTYLKRQVGRVKGNAHRHKLFIMICLYRRRPDLRPRRIMVCPEVFSCGSRPQTNRGRLSEYPLVAAASRVTAVHGQPCSRAHFSTSTCPPRAAETHVCSSHGQCRSHAHCNASRCPPAAADSQVAAFQGQ